MKITRYFQSCLLVEEDGARILIDPSGQEKDRLDSFGKIDAVLFTHKDGDHFDADLAQKLMEAGAKVFANSETAKQMKAQPTVVSDGQEYEVKGVKIMAKDMPHCAMVDGGSGSQNTGYLVAGRLLHTGDSVRAGDVKAEIVAPPLSAPDISLRDTYDLVVQVSAKDAVPVHYDFLGGNPRFLERYLKDKGVSVHSLQIGESAEL